MCQDWRSTNSHEPHPVGVGLFILGLVIYLQFINFKTHQTNHRLMGLSVGMMSYSQSHADDDDLRINGDRQQWRHGEGSSGHYSNQALIAPKFRRS